MTSLKANAKTKRVFSRSKFALHQIRMKAQTNSETDKWSLYECGVTLLASLVLLFSWVVFLSITNGNCIIHFTKNMYGKGCSFSMPVKLSYSFPPPLPQALACFLVEKCLTSFCHPSTSRASSLLLEVAQCHLWCWNS